MFFQSYSYDSFSHKTQPTLQHYLNHVECVTPTFWSSIIGWSVAIANLCSDTSSILYSFHKIGLLERHESNHTSLETISRVVPKAIVPIIERILVATNESCCRYFCAHAKKQMFYYTNFRLIRSRVRSHPPMILLPQKNGSFLVSPQNK